MHCIARRILVLWPGIKPLPWPHSALKPQWKHGIPTADCLGNPNYRHLLSHSFCRSEVLAEHSCIFCFRVSQGSQSVGWVVFTSGDSSREKKFWFQAHSGCRQNSLLYSSMTEGHGFLLTVGWKLPSGSRNCL